MTAFSLLGKNAMESPAVAPCQQAPGPCLNVGRFMLVYIADSDQIYISLYTADFINPTYEEV